MSWTKVWRDLTTKKLRTLLVVLSIAVGVMAISTVFGARAALLPNMQAAYLATNPSDIVIQLGDDIEADVLAQLAQHPDIVTAEGSAFYNARWQVDGKWQRIRVVVGDNILNRQLDKIELLEGAATSQADLMLEHLTTDVAEVAVGDQIKFQTATGENTLNLSGFVYDLDRASPKIGSGVTAYMNLDSAEILFGSNSFNRIHLKVRDENQIEAVSDEIQQLLESEYNLDIDRITKRDPAVNQGAEAVKAILAMMGGIGVLALLLSGFLVINTVSTILASEVPHIGTMKAIGGTRWIVMRVYLMMVLGYALLGSVIGLILGLIGLNLLISLLAGLLNIRLLGFAVPPISLALGILVGIIVPLLAAIVPIWKATGITVREAMMTYGLGGKTGRIEQLLTSITALPFGVMLSLRNLFRSKWRTFLTVTTLTLAGVAFVAVQATSSSLTSSLDLLFGTYNADLFVYSKPIARGDLLTLAEDLDGVEVSETWIGSEDTSQNPSLSVSGIPFDTVIYAYQDILLEGRWFAPDDKNTVIIPAQLAKNANHAVGDQLTTEINGHEQTWQIIGIVNDFNNDGRLLLTSYRQLTDVLEMPDMAGTLAIRLQNREHKLIDQANDLLAETMPAHGIQGRSTVLYQNEAQGRSNFRLLVLFLLSMVVLVTVVGALGLLGTLTINVTERIKEVGVMRSVGASSRSITQIFWLEGVLLGVLSWLMAALIGYPVARGFTNVLSSTMDLPMPFSMPPVTLLLLGVGIITVTTIASVFPALSAARARVADIIRYA